MQHPAADVLLRFLLGAASRQENREVVRHLLTRCPACAQALRSMKPDGPIEPPADPGEYDQALARFTQRLLVPAAG